MAVRRERPVIPIHGNTPLKTGLLRSLMKIADLSSKNEFIPRHIGPTDSDIHEMLKTLGFNSLDQMADKVIPSQIRTTHKYEDVGSGISE